MNFAPPDEIMQILETAVATLNDVVVFLSVVWKEGRPLYLQFFFHCAKRFFEPVDYRGPMSAMKSARCLNPSSQ